MLPTLIDSFRLGGPMRIASRHMRYRSFLALLVFLAMCTRAFSADSTLQEEFRKVCPGAKPTTSTFDKKDILFDSVLEDSPADKVRASSIVYCVQVKDAPYEYVLDWDEHGMKNLATTGRGYYGFRISHITRTLTSGPSVVYIGVNNTKVTPNLLKEQGELQALLGRVLETIFVGSVPKNPDKQDVERYQNLFPASLAFRARHKDGLASLEYLNAEPSQKRDVEFEFSDEIKKRIPELSGRLSVGPTPKSTSYKVTEPVPARVVITLKNSDHQGVASMPITIFLPSSK